MQMNALFRGSMNNRLTGENLSHFFFFIIAQNIDFCVLFLNYLNVLFSNYASIKSMLWSSYK